MIDGDYRGFTVRSVPPGIAVVTLEVPGRKNALGQGAKRDLQEILTQAQLDDDVRVVVLAGAGGDFCAGDDIGGTT
ncbi:MAG: hypothetical protein GEU78_18545, partial [Actinobacteria bacterium]|nr:hypothetical protein [Actinomycetota bacterium]